MHIVLLQGVTTMTATLTNALTQPDQTVDLVVRSMEHIVIDLQGIPDQDLEVTKEDEFVKVDSTWPTGMRLIAWENTQVILEGYFENRWNTLTLNIIVQ
jgi:hypothetical protein